MWYSIVCAKIFKKVQLPFRQFLLKSILIQDKITSQDGFSLIKKLLVHTISFFVGLYVLVGRIGPDLLSNAR